MSLPAPPPPPTCYRHPDRPTGRACTRCGRAACADCLVQADIGSQCVDCVRASRPAATERVRRWSATRTAVVTYALIAVNVAVFVYMMAKDANITGASGSVSSAERDLGLSRSLLPGEWYRLVTSGFIHFGLFHIAFNMYALFVLGMQLEALLGRVKFTLLYFAALLAGSLGVVLLDQNAITGGASGAIFGLFGALAVALWRRGINPMQTSLGTVLILNLALTFLVPGISIGGHIGGLVGGALCGLALFPPRTVKLPEWVGYATPVLVGFFSVAISMALAG